MTRQEWNRMRCQPGFHSLDDGPVRIPIDSLSACQCFVDYQILGPDPGKTPAALPEAENDI
jgi:hypothetical protein